ncbi:SIMPL domain-containing protein [Anabaenopsis elenkinii]|uniref:SIMPL domain-containing protein n=1 Tax=Anabaenopsis elenkinii CCIBt3563 TaxID=2779889 RepID=A0A7S6U584_9CYAN|nr:SIMPL domain-containing protein [Anabaenopsis elenkinii]QOV22199.1 SIMPL domain-containing protein [Anabaenopsis elenkinii CCIBt3563]
MYGAGLSASLFPGANCGKTLVLVLVSCIISIQPGLAQDRQRFLRTLTVSGRGVETIPTTLSQVSMSVEVQSKTAQLAQQEAAHRASVVLALLKSRNVEKLQTSGIRLNPVYSYTDNVQRITGYVANNTVRFQMATEQVGKLLDEAVKVGATQINSVSFIASDQAIASAQKEALRQATQDAQEQANAVLSTLGLQSQEVVSIQINSATAPPPPMLERDQVLKLANIDSSTPVIGGEQQVEASVTLQISY